MYLFPPLPRLVQDAELGFEDLNPSGLSLGVSLLQALIRCVAVSETIQTKPLHVSLCAVCWVHVFSQGLVSALGWNRSTINAATGKLIFFLVFNKLLWGMEILGWFSTDEWRLETLVRMYGSTGTKIKVTAY